MKIVTRSSLRTIAGTKGKLPQEVVFIEDKSILQGVYVPWEVWSQIQHFVSRIIERDQVASP